ncbi:hypothetical protein ERJ75_001161800 [Trypanosoma vivax]|nr:hypothetical protein ERJ75_001161800 [Trypanosoma vivax]
MERLPAGALDVADSSEYEAATAAVLLEKIKQRSVMERERRVKVLVRRGVPSPTRSALQEITEQRAQHENALKRKRRLICAGRQTNYWRGHVSYEPQALAAQEVVTKGEEVGSLEGRAVLLSHLITVFRMLLCENRARGRLKLLSARRSSFLPDTPPLASDCPTAVEVARFVEEGLVSPHGDAGCATSVPRMLLTSTLFEARPLRTPFVFLSRQYQMERLPEFTLNLTRAVERNSNGMMEGGGSGSPVVLLQDFIQPAITMETYDGPTRAYDLVQSPNPVQGHEPFSSVHRLEQPFSAAPGADGEQGTLQSEGASVVDARLSQELGRMGVPHKLCGPLQDDSLSASEDDEDRPQAARVDLSWLPPYPPPRGTE